MIVLISGGIAVGKTTVAAVLANHTDGRHIRVRAALSEVLGVAAQDRKTLQVEGAALDKRTGGLWLLDYLLEQSADVSVAVVDAVRTRRQTLPLLNGLPDAHLVHLSAHVNTRRLRYAEASATDVLKTHVPFDAAIAHETERLADELADLAELTLPTDDLTALEVVELILQSLGDLPVSLGPVGPA